ncbi:pyridoxamine 5'-phosphate oxidase family protein [Noviherbaspirillum aerium]|uniref:pyridoxamine 5'-phosphate oxidase family protein n=1 Tax=Noviherbaspirillum aerium TaxID=2588497 RepID=UPI00124DF7E4|nr:pyridoxamine 5'-phosphate oxidase family protein [Noviherbaspirillum aerium]
MDKSTEQFILDIINHGKDLTLATIRPDGYPQATTVSYANDGMNIYVGIGKDSQKAHNLRRNNKVSLTINAPYKEWNEIKGLSISGTAEFLNDTQELKHAADCMIKRFPQLLEWTRSNQTNDVLLLKIRPQFLSVLDYQKGFGHTELVQV